MERVLLIKNSFINNIFWSIEFWLRRRKSKQNLLYNQDHLPTISIITPNIAHGTRFLRTLKSVLFQDYPNVEHLIVETKGSHNNTAVVDRYVRKYPNKLKKLVIEYGSDQTKLINVGLNHSKGNIVNWLNCGDEFEADTFLSVAGYFSKNKESAAWIGGCRLIDYYGRRILTVYSNNLDRDNLGYYWSGGHFRQPACFLNKKAVDQAGGLDESIEYEYGYDLWLRLCENRKLFRVNDVWAISVLKDGKRNKNNRRQRQSEILKVKKKYGFSVDAISSCKNQFERTGGANFTGPPELNLSSYHYENPEIASSHLEGNHVYVISNYLPRFDRTSAHLRIFNILKLFLKLGLKVTFFYSLKTNDDKKYIDAFKDKINFQFCRRYLDDDIFVENNDERNYVWITSIWDVSDFEWSIKLVAKIRSRYPSVKIITDTMDFHFKRFERKYEITKDLNIKRNAFKIKDLEKEMYQTSDTVAVVTEKERADIQKTLKIEEPIFVIPNIHETFQRTVEYIIQSTIATSATLNFHLTWMLLYILLIIFIRKYPNTFPMPNFML